MRFIPAPTLAFVLPLVLTASRVSGNPPEERVLYSRADLVEALTGQVELRRAVNRSIELPVPECPQGRFACSVETIYSQVYELSFSAEKFSRREDRIETTWEDRGRLLMALDFEQKDADAFDGALRAELAGLSAPAFTAPQAGMGYRRGSLEQDVLDLSRQAAWVCTELNHAYSCDIRMDPTSYSGSGAAVEPAGRSISGSVAASSPDIVRTVPDVRAMDRTAIRLRSSPIAEATWADRLATVPDGATFEKRILDGKRTGAVRDIRGNRYYGHEGRYNNVERDVLLPRASLELAGLPMWVGEWHFETTHEVFGTAPAERADASPSLLMAVVPIADPLMDNPDRIGSRVDFPADRFVGSAVNILEREMKLNPDAIVKGFSDPELWPARGDYLVVTCRDDGNARYGIAPFVDAAAVGNPREACAAIRMQLR